MSSIIGSIKKAFSSTPDYRRRNIVKVAVDGQSGTGGFSQSSQAKEEHSITVESTEWNNKVRNALEKSHTYDSIAFLSTIGAREMWKKFTGSTSTRDAHGQVGVKVVMGKDGEKDGQEKITRVLWKFDDDASLLWEGSKEHSLRHKFTLTTELNSTPSKKMMEERYAKELGDFDRTKEF